MNNKNSKIFALVLHYSALTLFLFFGRYFLSGFIENEGLYSLIRSFIINPLIWTVPVLLLIHYFKSDIYISLREMFTSKVSWLKYLLIVIIFMIGALFTVVLIWVTGRFAFVELIMVLFTTIEGEMVFRGWLLNAIYREDKKWFCFFINAVMVSVINIPFGILSGKFILPLMYRLVTRLIFSFISSFILGYCFIKSRNILVPIAISTIFMYGNLLVQYSTVIFRYIAKY